MAILCGSETKLLVQGMGRMGQYHARLSVEYGTRVVGGVRPGLKPLRSDLHLQCALHVILGPVVGQEDRAGHAGTI